MTPNSQRRPSDDEQIDDFVNAGEHEDIVPEHDEDTIWQELEKQEQKINDYWELQNEKIGE